MSVQSLFNIFKKNFSSPDSINSISSIQSPTSTMGSPPPMSNSRNMGSPPLITSPSIHSHSSMMHSPAMQSPTLSSMGSVSSLSSQEDIKPMIGPSGIPTHPMSQSMMSHISLSPSSLLNQGAHSPLGMPGSSMNKGICAVCGDRASGKYTYCR